VWIHSVNRSSRPPAANVSDQRRRFVGAPVANAGGVTANDDRCIALSGLVFVPGLQRTWPQPALGTHDVKDEDSLAVVAVENATRCLDNLAVTRLPHLRGTGTTLGLLHQLLNVLKNSLNKTACRLRVIESDVIGNGVEVMESRLSPD
jgi:hypothetical protein